MVSFLQQARQASEQNNDPLQTNSLLIQAAETLYLEQQYVKSINLLKVLVPELTDQAQLSKAYLALAEAYFAHANSHASLCEELLAQVNSQFVSASRLATLKSSLLLYTHDWLNAAKELMNTDLVEAEKSQKIWQALAHLSLADLEKARWKHNDLLPWIQLAIIVQQHGLMPNTLRQEITLWQNQNLGHKLQTDLPESVKKAMQITPISAKKIAVLLPLTGRLSSQGNVLKDGFLAAYLNNPKINEQPSSQAVNEQLTTKVEQSPLTVRFFDSADKTAEQLNALVADYDVVVGPLLKEKIQGLADILPVDKVMLALNRIDQPAIEQSNSSSPSPTKEHYFFSLAPEDEAQQLAEFIRHKQLKRPIIFASNNSVTERMAAAFVKKWQEIPNSITPDITIFKDNKEMRRQVAEMLDVEQSKTRIKQIEYLSNVEVTGQERNRRDIDAIVVFANPEETALLNPIIEASLSSFAEISLSVFASSRSYSQIQTTGSLRDLRNLTFSDMPLLLPDHQWPDLTGQINQLWPQRKDSLLRLFAMGYDAYNFIPQLRQLRNQPQLSTQGLTGKISVVAGEIKRELPFAKIGRNRVQPLEMD
ncbi:penicillin-binding protein activator [Paraglaciecola aquimarina]|uniref:Penicillin-binding protein activator n=1 Tax=Paraglaciecola aquimarina TaxID=1235557 RepID=A0ABU3SVV8_9ALTE|nr:penicillin-binding protein activator [Paraglaciecola aquimarina]MDU0354057.1 penicillin-binding protein activator [Paraglaciecola aquimarina]